MALLLSLTLTTAPRYGDRLLRWPNSLLPRPLLLSNTVVSVFTTAKGSAGEVWAPVIAAVDTGCGCCTCRLFLTLQATTTATRSLPTVAPWPEG